MESNSPQKPIENTNKSVGFIFKKMGFVFNQSKKNQAIHLDEKIKWKFRISYILSCSTMGFSILFMLLQNTKKVQKMPSLSSYEHLAKHSILGFIATTCLTVYYGYLLYNSVPNSLIDTQISVMEQQKLQIMKALSKSDQAAFMVLHKHNEKIKRQTQQKKKRQY